MGWYNAFQSKNHGKGKPSRRLSKKAEPNPILPIREESYEKSSTSKRDVAFTATQLVKPKTPSGIWDILEHFRDIDWRKSYHRLPVKQE